MRHLARKLTFAAATLFLSATPILAQTLSGGGTGTLGSSVTSGGLVNVAGTSVYSTLTQYGGTSTNWDTPMASLSSGDTSFISAVAQSGQSIASQNAANRFGGTISGLTAGQAYVFELLIGTTSLSPTVEACPALGMTVDGVLDFVTAPADGVWSLLQVSFTASADTVSFESQLDGRSDAADCVGNYYFGPTAVQLASGGGSPDSDGDGETDDTDPAPYDPCTDSSGTGTSAYALANCVDISMVKTGGIGEYSCGVGELEWTLTVANAGPADATDVLVNDYPIAGITGIASVSSTSCTALPCTIPSMPAGSSEAIVVCTN